MRVDHVDLLALTLLGYMALSLAWSTDVLQGQFQLTSAAALCAVFMWVRRYPGFIPEAAMLTLTGALVLQVANPVDWGGFGNMNFQTEAMLLLLALGSQTRFTPAFILLFAVTGFYLAWMNPSKIEWFVLLALGVFYGCKLYRVHRVPA